MTTGKRNATLEKTETVHIHPRNKKEEIVPEQGNVSYRYSDQELEEFRVLITQRLDAAKKEVQYLQGLMQGKDSLGEDVSSERRFSLEDGSGATELEQRGQLIARQIQFVNNLENALIRIMNKTYGVCRVTGKLIDKARLRAVPHATLSMEAKKK